MATVSLRRGSTVLETRYVNEIGVNMIFVLADTPGAGTWTYRIVVDDVTYAVARRDMIAIFAKK